MTTLKASLPNRQLRNKYAKVVGVADPSLPNRQLRKKGN